MRARIVALALALAGPAGCAPHAAPAVAPAGPAIHVAPAVPAALRNDAARSLTRRARVARGGPIRFERAGKALDGGGAPIDADVVHLVVEETPAWVRILTTGDDARLLIWVRRDDLAPVALRARRLIEPETGTPGAVLRPGAAVAVVGAHGATRDVTFDDGAVVASGAMPAADLGTVFDARPPRAPEVTGSLAAGARISAAPSPAAPVIATTTGSVDASALGPARDGWIELELDRPWVYVRGFVPAAAMSPGDHVSTFTTGGNGYAMSDTDTLVLSAGACLYASPGGPVVGVNLAERIRYASGADRPGWRRVVVATDWGLLWPAVHYPERDGKAVGDFDRCPMK